MLLECGESGQFGVYVRAMSRVDASVVFGESLVGWEMVEAVRGDWGISDGSGIELVAERGGQIVGWLRARRVCVREDVLGTRALAALRRAWWMPEQAEHWQGGAGLEADPAGEVLFGMGVGVLARLGNLPELRGQVLEGMYRLGRDQVVRKLGLGRWVAQVPLVGLGDWQACYSAAGYVQQVEGGAIEDRVLSDHLRRGARVLAVEEGGAGEGACVWVVWENPV